jgi:hypothetical protein
VVSEKKIFKVFPFGCHGNQSSAWNSNFLTILKGHHLSIIPVKFHQNWPSRFREDVD